MCKYCIQVKSSEKVEGGGDEVGVIRNTSRTNMATFWIGSCITSYV